MSSPEQSGKKTHPVEERSSVQAPPTHNKARESANQRRLSARSPECTGSPVGPCSNRDELIEHLGRSGQEIVIRDQVAELLNQPPTQAVGLLALMTENPEVFPRVPGRRCRYRVYFQQAPESWRAGHYRINLQVRTGGGSQLAVDVTGFDWIGELTEVVGERVASLQTELNEGIINGAPSVPSSVSAASASEVSDHHEQASETSEYAEQHLFLTRSDIPHIRGSFDFARELAERSPVRITLSAQFVKALERGGWLRILSENNPDVFPVLADKTGYRIRFPRNDVRSTQPWSPRVRVTYVPTPGEEVPVLTVDFVTHANEMPQNQKPKNAEEEPSEKDRSEDPPGEVPDPDVVPRVEVDPEIHKAAARERALRRYERQQASRPAAPAPEPKVKAPRMVAVDEGFTTHPRLVERLNAKPVQGIQLGAAVLADLKPPEVKLDGSTPALLAENPEVFPYQDQASYQSVTFHRIPSDIAEAATGDYQVLLHFRMSGSGDGLEADISFIPAPEVLEASRLRAFEGIRSLFDRMYMYRDKKLPEEKAALLTELDGIETELRRSCSIVHQVCTHGEAALRPKDLLSYKSLQHRITQEGLTGGMLADPEQLDEGQVLLMAELQVLRQLIDDHAPFCVVGATRGVCGRMNDDQLTDSIRVEQNGYAKSLIETLKRLRGSLKIPFWSKEAKKLPKVSLQGLVNMHLFPLLMSHSFYAVLKGVYTVNNDAGVELGKVALKNTKAFTWMGFDLEVHHLLCVEMPATERQEVLKRMVLLFLLAASVEGKGRLQVLKEETSAMEQCLYRLLGCVEKVKRQKKGRPIEDARTGRETGAEAIKSHVVYERDKGTTNKPFTSASKLKISQILGSPREVVIAQQEHDQAAQEQQEAFVAAATPRTSRAQAMRKARLSSGKSGSKANQSGGNKDKKKKRKKKKR